MFFVLISCDEINAISTKRNTLLQLIRTASRQSKESVTGTREHNKPQASLIAKNR